MEEDIDGIKTQERMAKMYHRDSIQDKESIITKESKRWDYKRVNDTRIHESGVQ